MSRDIAFTGGDAVVAVEVAGSTLRLQQTPSPVLGPTVWDSSIVQVQYLAGDKHWRQQLAGELKLVDFVWMGKGDKDRWCGVFQCVIGPL